MVKPLSVRRWARVETNIRGSERIAIMVPTLVLESAIQKELTRVYLCTLEELCALLPQFSADQIAVTVERLAQEGVVACRSAEPSRTILWLPPTRSSRKVLDQRMPAEPLDSTCTALQPKFGQM